MTELKDLNNNHTIQWCPGCGDFGVLMAIKQAIVQLGLNPKDVVIVSGIGCSSKLPHYINTYGFETIHGRGLAAATGIKLANPDLTVIAVGGDGDGYGIGLNHFIHAARRNIDVTYIVMNNLVYGLTKGQTSPTSLKGTKTKSTPHGAIEYPVNPIAIALAAEGTFISRSFAGNLKHMVDMIKKGIQHKGFSHIDVFQQCVSWNNVQTAKFYIDNTYELSERGHDPKDRMQAYQKAEEWGPKNIPIGLFYVEERPTYNDELPWSMPPVAKQPIENIDISPLVEKYF